MHLDAPKSPDLLVEIWTRSKKIRLLIAKSKRKCKCEEEERVKHTCRRDLPVNPPSLTEMPQMGVALSESWVKQHVCDF